MQFDTTTHTLTANGSVALFAPRGSDPTLQISGSFGGGSVTVTDANGETIPEFDAITEGQVRIVRMHTDRLVVTLSGATSPSLVAEITAPQSI